MKGTLVWSKKLEPAKTKMGWGMAASPVLHKDRVYIVNDNEDQSYLLALDKKTGIEVWKVDRAEKSGKHGPRVRSPGEDGCKRGAWFPPRTVLINPDKTPE